MNLGSLYDVFWTLGGLLVCVALLVTIVFIAFLPFFGRGRKAILIQAIAFAAPIGFAGMATGYLIGLSRESAVGALVSAVLTLIGGIATFLVVRQNDFRSQVIVGAMVTLLSMNTLVGTLIGAHTRAASVVQPDDINALMSLAAAEYEINKVRATFQLEKLSLENLLEAIAKINAIRNGTK